MAPELLAAVGNAPELAVGNQTELQAQALLNAVGNAPELAVGNEPELAAAAAPAAASPAASPEHETVTVGNELEHETVTVGNEITRDHGTGWVQSTDSRHPTAPFTEGILHPPTDAYSSDDAYSSSLDLSNSGEGCCVTLPNRHEHLAFSKDLANIEYFREIREISRVRAFTM
jgi:hypothetical protein